MQEPPSEVHVFELPELPEQQYTPEAPPGQSPEATVNPDKEHGHASQWPVHVVEPPEEHFPPEQVWPVGQSLLPIQGSAGKQPATEAPLQTHPLMEQACGVSHLAQPFTFLQAIVCVGSEHMTAPMLQSVPPNGQVVAHELEAEHFPPEQVVPVGQGNNVGRHDFTELQVYS